MLFCFKASIFVLDPWTNFSPFKIVVNCFGPSILALLPSHKLQLFLRMARAAFYGICILVRVGECLCVQAGVSMSVYQRVRVLALVLAKDLERGILFPQGFLDASSHLYNRVCPSVRPSVGPSRFREKR